MARKSISTTRGSVVYHVAGNVARPRERRYDRSTGCSLGAADLLMIAILTGPVSIPLDRHKFDAGSCAANSC